MVDILAVAAHPDDVELNVAGTLMNAADAGRTFAVCDLTQGERGTRGSVELRQHETERANRVLGLTPDLRWNLEIPDGNVRVVPENILKVVRAIRRFQPTVLLFPWERDRHPDHANAHRLIHEACFDAGLTNVTTEWDGQQQTPHRPKRLYTFQQAYEHPPDFIVDISDQFERKLEAIAAYSSQFTVPGHTSGEERDEPETFISQQDFMEFIIARMRHWGFLIGAKYGEAFCTVAGPLKVDDLMHTV